MHRSAGRAVLVADAGDVGVDGGQRQIHLAGHDPRGHPGGVVREHPRLRARQVPGDEVLVGVQGRRPVRPGHRLAVRRGAHGVHELVHGGGFAHDRQGPGRNGLADEARVLRGGVHDDGVAGPGQRRDVVAGAGVVVQTQVEHDDGAGRDPGRIHRGEPQGIIGHAGVEQSASNAKTDNLMIVDDYDGSGCSGGRHHHSSFSHRLDTGVQVLSRRPNALGSTISCIEPTVGQSRFGPASRVRDAVRARRVIPHRARTTATAHFRSQAIPSLSRSNFSR